MFHIFHSMIFALCFVFSSSSNRHFCTYYASAQYGSRDVIITSTPSSTLSLLAPLLLSLCRTSFLCPYSRFFWSFYSNIHSAIIIHKPQLINYLKIIIISLHNISNWFLYFNGSHSCWMMTLEISIQPQCMAVK